jgi:DivIVA domain-containing protein
MEVLRVALDRQSIEKRDFPVGRRGYDPEAVDAHLSTLADEIQEFKRTARRRSDTLASSASDQVRSIVEAAETSAADIQREAETEAREIRDEASNEARATREQATEQARDYVGKVSEGTAEMLQRLDAMESELSGLIDSLRTGTTRIDSDLRLLENGLTEVRDVVTPRPQFELEAEPEPVVEAIPEPEPEVMPAATIEPFDTAEEAPETVNAVPEDEVLDLGSEEPESLGADPVTEALPEAGQAEGADDSEGARLIALNMALNGTPREETAKYLSENFQLSDRDGLLDEVYASVEG